MLITAMKSLVLESFKGRAMEIGHADLLLYKRWIAPNSNAPQAQTSVTTERALLASYPQTEIYSNRP